MARPFVARGFVVSCVPVQAMRHITRILFGIVMSIFHACPLPTFTALLERRAHVRAPARTTCLDAVGAFVVHQFSLRVVEICVKGLALRRAIRMFHMSQAKALCRWDRSQFLT